VSDGTGCPSGWVIVWWGSGVALDLHEEQPSTFCEEVLGWIEAQGL
jgi:hypothetical protein